MPNKTCKTCSVTKPTSAFYKQALRGVYGVRGSCKDCDNKTKQAYRLAKGTELLVKKRDEYERNKSARLTQKRVYRQANKGKINALVTARKKIVKQRSPVWVEIDDKWLIKEAYDLASLRTKMFGFAWHVDHVLPLQGKTVSGLHVPTNLQVIPGVLNIKKKNKVQHA